MPVGMFYGPAALLSLVSMISTAWYVGNWVGSPPAPVPAPEVDADGNELSPSLDGGLLSGGSGGVDSQAAAVEGSAQLALDKENIQRPDSEIGILPFEDTGRVSTDQRTRVYCHSGHSFLEFWQTMLQRKVRIETLRPEAMQQLEVKYWVEDSVSNLVGINPGFAAPLLGCPYFWSNADHCELQVTPFSRMCIEVRLHDSGMLSVPFFSRREPVPFSINISDAVAIIPLVYRVASIILGLAVVMHAKDMARSTKFHYVSGTTIGVGFFGLILILYLVRLFGIGKGKAAMAGIAAAYTSLLGWLFQRAKDVFVQYWPFVIGYVVISALLSFAVAHWFLRGGGRVDREVADLLRWGISLVGFTLSCFSTTDSFIYSCICFVVYFAISVKLASGEFSFASLEAYMEPPPAPPPPVCYNKRGYVTDEQMKTQSQITTDRELEKLMKSKEYQKWMVRNTHRMAVSHRANTFDDSDEY